MGIFGDWIRRCYKHQKKRSEEKFNELYTPQEIQLENFSPGEVTEKTLMDHLDSNIKENASRCHSFWQKKTDNHIVALLLGMPLTLFFIPHRLKAYDKGEKSTAVRGGFYAPLMVNFATLDSYKQLDDDLRKDETKKHFWGVNRDLLAYGRAVRQTNALVHMCKLRAQYYENVDSAKEHIDYTVSRDGGWYLGSPYSICECNYRVRTVAGIRDLAALGVESEGKSAVRNAEEYNNVFIARFERAKNSKRSDDQEFCNWIRLIWRKTQEDSDKQILEYAEKTTTGAKEAAQQYLRVAEPFKKGFASKSSPEERLLYAQEHQQTLKEAWEEWRNSEDAQKFAKAWGHNNASLLEI